MREKRFHCHYCCIVWFQIPLAAPRHSYATDVLPMWDFIEGDEHRSTSCVLLARPPLCSAPRSLAVQLPAVNLTVTHVRLTADFWLVKQFVLVVIGRRRADKVKGCLRQQRSQCETHGNCVPVNQPTFIQYSTQAGFQSKTPP